MGNVRGSNDPKILQEFLQPGIPKVSTRRKCGNVLSNWNGLPSGAITLNPFARSSDASLLVITQPRRNLCCPK